MTARHIICAGIVMVDLLFAEGLSETYSMSSCSSI